MTLILEWPISIIILTTTQLLVRIKNWLSLCNLTGSNMHIVRTLSSSMIWILTGMCKMLLLSPCTSLKLCKSDQRLLDVIAIIGRGIGVHVTAMSLYRASCWMRLWMCLISRLDSLQWYSWCYYFPLCFCLCTLVGCLWWLVVSSS